MNEKWEMRELIELDEELEGLVKEFRKNNSDGRDNSPTPESIALHKDKYCSDGDVVRWLLVFEGKNLAGMLAVFEREVGFGGEKVLLGGVGKVRVGEKYRRKGMAGWLMKRAMEIMHEKGCEVAYLCTRLNTFLKDFYEKYGFEVLRSGYKYRSKSGKVYEEYDGMIAPIKSVKLFEELMTVKRPFDIGQGNW